MGSAADARDPASIPFCAQLLANAVQRLPAEQLPNLLRHPYIEPSRARAELMERAADTLKNDGHSHFATELDSAACEMRQMLVTTHTVTCLFEECLQAAQRGDVFTLRRLNSKLRKNGARLDLTSASGESLAHRAAEHNQIRVLDFLSACGARMDIQHQSYNLAAPAHVAAALGHCKVLEFLRAKGIPLNVRDGDGNTPAHQAALTGNLVRISVLLREQLRMRNMHGLIPSQMAPVCRM